MDIRDFNKLNDLPVEDYVHFELIKLAKKLQPKVIIAGAAIGALKGKSKYYSIKMLEKLQNSRRLSHAKMLFAFSLNHQFII